MLIFIWFL